MSSTVQPNPFTTTCSIIIQNHNARHASFIIKNIFGETVYDQTELNLFGDYANTVNLSKLYSGIYFIDILIDDKRIMKKICKE